MSVSKAAAAEEQTQNQAGAAGSVYERRGDHWFATSLSRGPWSPDAQHGGAPCGLVTHLAESAFGPGWHMSRLTVDLVRPVPLGELEATVDTTEGRSTARAMVSLYAAGREVLRATVLLQKTGCIELPANIVMPATLPFPPPQACSQAVSFSSGTQSDLQQYHGSAILSRVARGDPTQPGPLAAWMRLNVPMIDGVPNTGAVCVAAVADFGSGLSWVLPFGQYLFSNADVSISLLRPPVGEWVGVDATSHFADCGTGSAISTLYDVKGYIGTCMQNLVVRDRS